MTSTRRFVRTAKGSKALRLGLIGLDARHVKVLEALSPNFDERGLAHYVFLSPADTVDICQKLVLVGYARSASAADAQEVARFEDMEARVEQNEEASTAAILAPDLIGPGSRRGDPQAREALAQRLADARSDLSRKLDKERAQRAVAEKALLEARERTIELETERFAAQEALNRERVAQAERSRAEAEERSLREIERAAALVRERAIQAERQRIEAEERLAAEEHARVVEAERTRHAAEERVRRDAERTAALDLERARARRQGVYRRRRNSLAGILAFMVVAGGAWRYEQAMSLNPERCSKLLSEWAGSPARVTSCETSLWGPSFSASGISLGTLALAGAKGRVSLPLLVFTGRAELSSLALRGLSLDATATDALLRVPRLGKMGSVREVEIESVRFSVGNAYIDGLAGQAKLDANGRLEQIILLEESRSTRLSVEHEKGTVKIAFQTRFPDPTKAPIPGATEVSAYGTLASSGVVVDEATLSFKNGSARFSGATVWSEGAWIGKGKFDARQLPLAEIAPWIFRGGSAELTGNVSFAGASLESAAAGAVLDMRGQARDLALHIDVNEMIGIPGAQGFSLFSQANLSSKTAAGSTSFYLPDLRSGPVKASVEATRDAGGLISGKASVAMSSRSLAAEAVLRGDGSRMRWTLR